MAWSRGGTVSVTKNSTTVTGVGTGFVANSRVGDAFLGPDGAWYEVANIASDTALSILPAYLGASASGAAYALAPIQGYTKASADALRSLVNSYGTKLANLGTTGNYDILPVEKGGTGGNDQLTARSSIGAAKSGVNADITALSGLTTPLTPVQGGTSQSYIEGFKLLYTGGNNIVVTSGSAYIPSLQGKVDAPGQLISQTASLSANSWYHVYLYVSSGVAAIEMSSVDPSAPYYGRARTKSGDPSRRYLGSFLTMPNAAIARFQHHLESGRIAYNEPSGSAPMALLAGFTDTAVSVSCSSVVPVTGYSMHAIFFNTDSSCTARFCNADMGPSSAGNHQIQVPPGDALVADQVVSLNTRQVSYVSTGPVAASSIVTMRCLGYLFER